MIEPDAATDVPRDWVLLGARALAGPGVPWPLLPHQTQEALLTDSFRCLYTVLPHIRQAMRDCPCSQEGTP